MDALVDSRNANRAVHRKLADVRDARGVSLSSMEMSGIASAVLDDRNAQIVQILRGGKFLGFGAATDSSTPSRLTVALRPSRRRTVAQRASCPALSLSEDFYALRNRSYRDAGACALGLCTTSASVAAVVGAGAGPVGAVAAGACTVVVLGTFAVVDLRRWGGQFLFEPLGRLGMIAHGLVQRELTAAHESGHFCARIFTVWPRHLRVWAGGDSPALLCCMRPCPC